MLNSKQISEIHEHLEKAQNPLFFFDNDADGLCSFLLLQRFIGRGKGIPIKSFPEMTKGHFRRIGELNADYVFILDKPEVSREFFEEVEKINVPIVWIDHHYVEDLYVPGWVNYYNELGNISEDNSGFARLQKTAEPTTFLCWQVVGDLREDDLWLAVVGCIADSFLPKYYKDFLKKFPELGFETNNAFDVLYESDIGKIAQIFNAGLKDRITNVIKMLKFLMGAKGPYDVLEISSKNKEMNERFILINKKQKKFVEKAKVSSDEGKLLFFQYGGNMSISSDLANELCYLYPDKIIVVVYVTGVKANISLRGKNVKGLLLKVIDGFEGAMGGGHNDAVGGLIRIEDLEKFKSRIEELTKQ